MARAATFRAPSSSRRRSRRPSGTACPASSVETVGCPCQPSNTAIASPSLSVTIAFFHAERRPARPEERPPVRRRARTTRVRTSVTVTLNSVSIAARICGLVAAVSTRKAYSLRAWYAAEDFSVITGPTIKRCWSGISSPLLPLCLLRRLAALQRRQLHHHGVRPQDLVRGRVREPHHEHVGDVPPREVDVVRARRAGREHQYFLVRDPQLPEQLGQGLGLRLLVLERVDHEQGLLARPRIQRGFLRELAHLLRNAQPVVAGMGPEHDPAVPPVRRARRALPRPAGALLAPRLLVAARDFAPGLRVARPLALVREEGDHGAVQCVLVHRAVEQRGRQTHRFLLRAGGGVVRRLNHDGSALPVCAP